MTAAAPLSPGARRRLLVLLGGGVLARLVVAFTTHGLRFDLDSLFFVDYSLRARGLHVYEVVNPIGLYRWPYPPGYFPWVLAAGGLSRSFSVPFHELVRIAPILADAVIAWLLAVGLGWRGSSERTRLLAAGLVMAGPVFFIVSGYHGQIDSVAILPALAGVLIWCRPGSGRDLRSAIAAGALIGVGAAIKTSPLLVVLALLPSARTWRLRAVLLGAAIVVPVLSLAPFALADSHGVRHLLAYHGGAGAGGLSLAVQPDLAHFWISSYWAHHVTPLMPSGASRFLLHHGALATGIGVALLGMVALWRRLEPVPVAVLIWLGFYAFGTGFFFQYLVWGLPFFLLAGRVREVAALQLAILPGMVLFYFGPHGSTAAEIAFAAIMLLVWLALLGAFTGLLVAVVRPRGPTLRPDPARRAGR